MKKYIKIITVFLGVCTTVSCDPTLVDEGPTNATELSYFNTVIEFRTQIVGTYAGIYDDYHFAATGWNGWIAGIWLLPGDDLTESQGANAFFELFNGSLNPSNSRLQFAFQSTYKRITRATVFIDRVTTVDYSNYEGADEISMMHGEALFLRAYGYFKLFNIFGSVPLVTKRLGSDETNTPKSPANDIITQVIDDLKLAIDKLPDSWPSEFKGRVTKNSARGLLMKALAHRGSHNKSDADFQEALTYYNAINATLVNNYTDNFSAFTENNQESLFELQAAAPSSGNNNLQLAHDGAWRGVENMSVYRGYMMEARGTGDFNDASGTKFLITQKLLDMHGNDPRIKVFLNPSDGISGRIFQKYNKPNGSNNFSGVNGGSTNNERILRYSDVILLAAEANAKTGNLPAAIGLINQVRTRARNWGQSSGIGDGVIPVNYPTTETDKSTVLEWVRNERFVELAGEGHRWWDLVRWHRAGDINISSWTGDHNGFSTYLASPVQFDVNKHLVFPIPQAEIDRNSAITENNPNY